MVYLRSVFSPIGGCLASAISFSSALLDQATELLAEELKRYAPDWGPEVGDDSAGMHEFLYRGRFSGILSRPPRSGVFDIPGHWRRYFVGALVRTLRIFDLRTAKTRASSELVLGRLRCFAAAKTKRTVPTVLICEKGTLQYSIMLPTFRRARPRIMPSSATPHQHSKNQAAKSSTKSLKCGTHFNISARTPHETCYHLLISIGELLEAL